MIDTQELLDQPNRDAIAWFGESLAPGEWINQTWIGRHATGELRMIDIVCPNSSHRLLYRLEPSDDDVARWDDLDYERVQFFVDQFTKAASANGFDMWEFAGAASAIPGCGETQTTGEDSGT